CGDRGKNYCETAEGSATPTNRPQQMCFLPLENFRKKTKFLHISSTDKYKRWKGNNDPKIGTWNTIRFMTYNVMAGAGAADPDPVDPDEYRLPKIMKILKAANPDILAIQEATSWDELNPPVVQQVAEELQMNYYFLGESGGVHPIALFSKFEIKEVGNLPEPFSKAIRAEIIAPNGESIFVFAVHVSAGPIETMREQLIFLVGEMDSYRDKAVILMGDMNFPDPDTRNGLHSILYDAGWCHPWLAQHHIDHIWTSPLLAPHVQPKIILEYELSLELSDHPPVAHDINIYFPAIKNELHPPLNFRLQRLENDYIFFKEYVDELSWDANPQNISNPVKYNLYRKINGFTDCSYELISELGPNVFNYEVRGLKKDSLYTYKITSVDESNRVSEPSEISNREEHK
ncbi:MAG: endonuclease/exonuclease/phosphatase family protein, partial [Candidatus Aminicenantes bacterium]|nr:endonuclease/exonuclease/phosphatase family protein [Candidatus Aminicenantes bacterium]